MSVRSERSLCSIHLVSIKPCLLSYEDGGGVDTVCKKNLLCLWYACFMLRRFYAAEKPDF
jgi:hypothetical protein